MIIDDNLLAIENQLAQLFQIICQGAVYQRYQITKQIVADDQQLQQQLADFTRIRDRYAAIADYGNTAPGFIQIQTDVLQAKRALDLKPKIQAFKRAETDLENLWGQISITIADSISTDIQVAAGNPFFEIDRRPHQR